MRNGILKTLGTFLMVGAGTTAGASTVSYYFQSPPLLESWIGQGEDLYDPYDPSLDSFYLEEALREYAHHIAGLRASFTIDWGYFEDRANLTISVWEPQWDRPEWLLLYDPPGDAEGLVIDEFSFGTGANGELLWFSMINWDIPPFFSIAWGPGEAYEFYNGFGTWVYGPDYETAAEVWFSAPPGGTLTTRVWTDAPSPVPLPAGALLLLSGLVGLVGLRRAHPTIGALHRRRVAA